MKRKLTNLIWTFCFANRWFWSEEISKCRTMHQLKCKLWYLAITVTRFLNFNLLGSLQDHPKIRPRQDLNRQLSRWRIFPIGTRLWRRWPRARISPPSPGSLEVISSDRASTQAAVCLVGCAQPLEISPEIEQITVKNYANPSKLHHPQFCGFRLQRRFGCDPSHAFVPAVY